MGDLTAGLVKLGLIRAEEGARALREEEHVRKSAVGQNLASLTTKTGRPTSQFVLENCASIGEFRESAKVLLLDHPEEIGKVIQLAHRFKDEDRKKFVWLLYQVRDHLRDDQNLKGDRNKPNREKFLKKAFRRSGAVVESIE